MTTLTRRVEELETQMRRLGAEKHGAPMNLHPCGRGRDYEIAQGKMLARGAKAVHSGRDGNVYRGGRFPLTFSPEGVELLWRWRQLSSDEAWWRRYNVRSGEFFGARYRFDHVTPDGNPIMKKPAPLSWTDLAAGMPGLPNAALKDLMARVPVWAETAPITGQWAAVEKKPMNIITIEMLFHFRCSPSRFPDPSYGTPAYYAAIDWMLKEELIRYVDPKFGFTREWELTERGDVLVDAIKATPLPVKKAGPEWIIPDNATGE